MARSFESESFFNSYIPEVKTAADLVVGDWLITASALFGASVSVMSSEERIVQVVAVYTVGTNRRVLCADYSVLVIPASSTVRVVAASGTVE